MKAIKSFFSTLFGLKGARLARLPFFLLHVLVYAIAYFSIQFTSLAAANAGRVYNLGELGFTLLILFVTLLLSPVYTRRAHDIGWSLKYVFWWSVVPAVLRLALLAFPLIALFNQNLILSLLKVMPYIGFAYWVMGQIQILFTVILMFAPSTGGHNRFAPNTSRSFTFTDMYGFTLIKRSSKKDIETKG